MQKETLQFFGAYRRFGRANKNMNKQSLSVCGVDMEELKLDGLERPGMAELLVYSMLVAHRHATTNVCWLSKRGCADKLCLSPSTVHEAYKWLEKAKLIYLHDDNRLVRRMVKNGKGHQVNLYTIFDLPGYRWASTVQIKPGSNDSRAPRYEREEQDANEGYTEGFNECIGQFSNVCPMCEDVIGGCPSCTGDAADQVEFTTLGNPTWMLKNSIGGNDGK